MSFPLVNILAIGAGAIIATAGTLLLLVAAFRRGVLWGLAVLFVPLGNVIFACRCWTEARTGFVAGLLGAAICLGGACTIPEIQEHFWEAIRHAPTARVPDLSVQIQEHREQLEALQAAFAQDGLELTREYQTLEKQRRELKPTDAAAIGKFNEAAAAYQARNAHRKQLQQDIQKAQQELAALLDTRARNEAIEAANRKRVVMYTTSHCPACQAAKQFLTQKGVPYEEIDVEASRDGAIAFQKLGGHGVPLIMVGDKKMEGFNPQALEAAL
jgi:glutaredoxin